jgi:hypothetical protein
MAGSYEHCNKPSGSMEDANFCKFYRLLKKSSAPRREAVTATNLSNLSYVKIRLNDVKICEKQWSSSCLISFLESRHKLFTTVLEQTN